MESRGLGPAPARCSGIVARFILLLGLGVALIGGAGQARGQTSSEEQLGLAVMGNTLFIFLHELGHGLRHELALPLVGQEEDVVDEFATFVLIEAGREDPTSHQLLLAAAQGFAEIWQLTQQQVGGDASRLPYWDEHGLDIKRFYNIVCLLYGSAPQDFTALVQQAGIPPERAARCVDEYNLKLAAWEKLLEPHMRPPDGTASGPQRGTISVSYAAPTSQFARDMETALRDAALFDTLARDITAAFDLPNDLTVQLKECGFANAFWNPQDRSITMCYELMAMFAQLLAGTATAAQPQVLPQAQPQPQPQPQPQLQPQPPGAQGSVVGMWNASYYDPSLGNAFVSRQILLQPDGSFVMALQAAPIGMLRSWGRYQVQPGAITFLIQGYDPPQICTQAGCTQLPVPAQEMVPYQQQGPNLIQTQLGPWQRIQ